MPALLAAIADIMGGTADVATVTLIIFTAALLIWAADRSAGYFNGIPAVGPPISGAISGFAEGIVTVLSDLSRILTQILVDVVHLAYTAIKFTVDSLTGWIMQPLSAVIGLANVTSQAVQSIEHWQNVTLPAIINNDIIKPLSSVIGLANVTSQAVQSIEHWQTFVLPQWISENLTKPLSAVIGLANVMSVAIQQLQHAFTVVTTTIIPALTGRVGAIEDLWRNVITKPITGLLDRVGSIERTLGGILPIWGALALSIPLAQTLGRIARDPCYCMTQGGLQQNGDLELAVLMDLI